MPCNVVQDAPDNAQEIFLFNVVLILLGHYTDKTLCNVSQHASDTIAQEKTLFNVVLGVTQNSKWVTKNVLWTSTCTISSISPLSVV